MAENRCYDPDCNDENCYNPKYYNYICFDDKCDEIHCTNSKHFDRNLLERYQTNTDLNSPNKTNFDENSDISLCGCPDCSDDDHEHNHEEDSSEEEGEELLAEGKPLIANRPIQIMVVSGVCFALGHILEYLSFDSQIVTVIFMICAVIAGYQIAISAYKSLVKNHTIGPPQC